MLFDTPHHDHELFDDDDHTDLNEARDNIRDKTRDIARDTKEEIKDLID